MQSIVLILRSQKAAAPYDRCYSLNLVLVASRTISRRYRAISHGRTLLPILIGAFKRRSQKDAHSDSSHTWAPATMNGHPDGNLRR